MSSTSLDNPRAFLKAKAAEFIENTRTAVNNDFDKFTDFHQNYFYTNKELLKFKKILSRIPDCEEMLKDLNRLELQIGMLEGKFINMHLKRIFAIQMVSVGFVGGILFAILDAILFWGLALLLHAPTCQ